jgi:hypothetical protein
VVLLEFEKTYPIYSVIRLTSGMGPHFHIWLDCKFSTSIYQWVGINKQWYTSIKGSCFYKPIPLALM